MSTSSQDSIVVVGSVAIDTVETPLASREQSIGGSATYFAMAASYHAPVQLVGVVGSDFPQEPQQDLTRHGVCLQGLSVEQGAKTFRWHGRYHENMNERDTLDTQLNCFESFAPNLPATYRGAKHLFLANIQPSLQLSVLEQMQTKPRLVGLDTMNLWIDVARQDLCRVLEHVDLLVINEQEAAQLSETGNMVRCAERILAMGPSAVVIKRGEYGAALFGPNQQRFALPALLLDQVQDPTGAGDCFAGGLMGWLATQPKIDEASLRKGVAWGTVMASYCCEGFSYDCLLDKSRPQLEARLHAFLGQCQVG